MSFSSTFHREHLRRRARERLGVKVTRNAAAQVKAGIRSGRFPRLDHVCGNPSRAVYLAEVLGRTCRVVYCHDTEELITVMSRGRTV